MFKTGDAVIYNSQVYTVEGITQKTIDKTVKDYYRLVNVYDSKNEVFIPADNEKLLGKISEILSYTQVIDMIKDLPNIPCAWIEDAKERATAFRAILEKGDRRETMQMVKTLLLRKNELEAKGRRLHSMDETLLARAQKAICDEFALVLGIEKDDVIPFITQYLN